MTRQSLSEAWFSFRASSIKCSFRALTWGWYSPCDITQDLACFLVHSLLYQPHQGAVLILPCQHSGLQPLNRHYKKDPLTGTAHPCVYFLSVHLMLLVIHVTRSFRPSSSMTIHTIVCGKPTVHLQLVCQKQSVHPTLVTWCQIVKYIAVLITHFLLLFFFTFAAQTTQRQFRWSYLLI